MERESSRESRGRQNVKHIIGHAGKDETIDMSISPDTITGPVDPMQILKDMRLLTRMKRRASGGHKKI